eukprot:331110-Prymnesium_polylepis.1
MYSGDARSAGVWGGYESGYDCGEHADADRLSACLAARDAHKFAVERNTATLERIACTPALEPGDGVLFLEHTFHRTQDMATNRLAMLVNVM